MPTTNDTAQVSDVRVCFFSGEQIPQDAQVSLVLTPDGEREMLTGATVPREYVYSEYQDAYILRNVAYRTNNGYVDESTYENWFAGCESCSDSFHVDDMADGLCEPCRDNEESEESSFRQPNLGTDKYRSEENGKTVLAFPTFGIELESTANSSYDRVNFCDAIPQAVGIVSDGSIEGDYPLEIVSPILSGLTGEKLVYTITEEARANSLEVNSSCGFHVHIGAEKFFVPEDVQALARRDFFENHEEVIATVHAKTEVKRKLKRTRTLLALYLAFEDVFLAMLPASRRNSRWCKSINADYQFNRVLSAKSYPAIERIWYKVRTAQKANALKSGGKYDNSRYHGVNLHNLFRNGSTIEIRYHTGTLNAFKILNWVSLHQHMVKTAIEAKIDKSTLRELHARRGNPLAERIATLKTILNLPDTLADYVSARANKHQPLCAE